MPALPPGPDYPLSTWRPAHSYALPTGRRIITALILHSGDGTLTGDLDTLTAPQSDSAHYYVARSGRVWQLVREANIAFHAGLVKKPQWSNAHTIGIEQQHVDLQDDWPDPQILAVARLVHHIRLRRGDLKLLGHADVCAPPGRKIDPAHYPWADLHVCILRLADSAIAAPAAPA